MTRLSDGMYKDYWVLDKAERQKDPVRPVRREYRHMDCFTVTRIHSAIAETMAHDPSFYRALFCVRCKDHFPPGEFVWLDTKQKVGS
jgi:hypothetical protein